MRIIGGKHRGAVIRPPANLPVRPTTDLAKEALFNILIHKFDLESIRALDLFSGTGSIALELASRQASRVLAVDQHGPCCRFIGAMKAKLNLDNLEVRKSGVLPFLQTNSEQFDLIFADPPYDMPSLAKLPEQILSSGSLAKDGWLVIEFPSDLQFPSGVTAVETRRYGQTSFGFYHHT